MPADPHDPSEEFLDPLENYEPREYTDPLERALAEEPVAAIRTHPFFAVRPQTPVREAVATLADLGIACLLVTDERDHLVGVFTKRDVLSKVAERYDEVADGPVSAVMTDDPAFVREIDTAGATLCVMADQGFRHVPVLDVDGQVTGIVVPTRVLEFLKQHVGSG